MTRSFVIVIVMMAIAAGGFLLQDKWQRRDAELADASHIDFTLPDLDGKPRPFSEWDGKSRIVNFWATWCAPCRREIPLLKKTQAEHADDNIQVIGIAVDFIEDVSAYAVEAEFNYPILIGQEDAMAVAEASGVEFIGMPFTLLVAPDGALLNAHMGEVVAADIDTILTVFKQLENGEVDLEAARDLLAQL